MWKWLRKKLGIVDHTKELIILKDDIHQVLQITTECLHLIQHGQINEQDNLKLRAIEDRLTKRLIDLNHDIKTIPKEMVIKNVLSI